MINPISRPLHDLTDYITEDTKNKPISRPMHGFTDYNYVTIVSNGPKLVGFKDEGTAALLCRVFSSTILLSSIFTRSEWGFLRIMPFKAHLVIDFLGGVMALGSPWLFGFSHNARARNFFLFMGIYGLLAALLTQPKDMA